MKKYINFLTISIFLIISSLIMFILHFIYFGEIKNTIYYSTMSICIIPINTLIVTVVFEKLLEKKAKKERLNKLNMLVGLFYSEMGYKLMNIMVAASSSKVCCIDSFSDFKYILKEINKHKLTIDFNKLDYVALENLLVSNKDLLINLISNENILEHEVFADLLMSVAHLRDEVIFRKDKTLSPEDKSHLKIDILRVYKTISIQWVHYLQHLQKHYPYLFNSALQNNPYRK